MTPEHESESRDTVLVWDRLIRITHWLLFTCVIVALVTRGEPELLHVWNGYMIAVLVLLRIIWGFCGSEYARFSQFVTSPFAAVGYLLDLIRSRAKRYVGHSPAGAWMAMLLIASLLGNVSTGMYLYALDEGAGPLAFLVNKDLANEIHEGMDSVVDQLAEADMHQEEDSDKERVEEIHELFANITQYLVLLHIAGVLLASYRHRENLTRAMFTGKKRRQ